MALLTAQSRTNRMKRIEEMSLWERLYFPEVIRGLTVTGYRFWRNLAVHTLHKLGLARKLQAWRLPSSIPMKERRILIPSGAGTA